MNVAPTAPASTAPAPATPSRGTGTAVDAAGTTGPAGATDPTVADASSDATGKAPFGELLSRRIDGGSEAADARTTNLRATDPRIHEATTDLPDATDAPVASGSAAKPTAAAADDARRTKDDAAATVDVASDLGLLASQLALVAQWAGAAKPVADASPTAAAPGAAIQPERKGSAIADRRDAGVTAARDDVAASDASSKGPATETIGTRERATAFSELAASIDAAAAKPGAAAVSPDAAGLALAPDAAAAATRTVQLVATAVPATGAVPDRLHEQVGTPAWSHEVGQAALRIAANDLQTASLRLNPEHLGPLDVQVRIDNGVAHVAFQAAHADTRQALEGSRAALDQLFQGQGLRTGDVSVATQAGGTADTARFGAPAGSHAGANPGGSSGNGRGDRGGRGGSDDGLAVSTTVRLVRAAGLVDTFA